MKTRTGFISNSSSSNFILRDTNNVLQVARRMIKVISDDKNKKLEKFDKLIEDNRDILSIDMPVTFISCNYDTYIYTLGPNLKIETCNNTNWDEALAPYYLTGNEDENTKPDCYFWQLDVDLLVKEIPYAESVFCKEHFLSSHFIFDEHTKMCPKCYLKIKDHKTFTQLNNTPTLPYIGKNIRRYLSTKED